LIFIQLILFGVSEKNLFSQARVREGFTGIENIGESCGMLSIDLATVLIEFVLFCFVLCFALLFCFNILLNKMEEERERRE